MISRPTTLADVAQRVIDGTQPFGFALREFLDSFYVTSPDQRAQMLADEPPLLGDPVHQAYLGAVGEHLARGWGCPIPPWSDHPSRFLTMPHFTTRLENLKALLLVESPLAFRRRMIFTEVHPLRRARMPKDLTPA